jgi:hypothetical protein
MGRASADRAGRWSPATTTAQVESFYSELLAQEVIA